MTRRVAALAAAFLVVSLVMPAAVVAADGTQADASAAVPAGPVAQQTANNSTAQSNTDTTEWEPPGPFSLSELQTGGTVPAASGDADAPKGARMLQYGGIQMRHRPISLLDSSLKPVESGDTEVNSNTLNLKTNAFLDSTGEYELVLVYWTKESKRVNDTSQTYAADQTIQRVSFNVASGYDASTVRLQPHYDQTVKVTAWLERDGERVDGARWLFSHRSNPLAASPAFNIDSRTDQWRWAGMYVIAPAVIALLASGKVAQHFLGRTIVGAQKGIGFWAFTVGLIGFITAGITTFATATVLANAPVVAGLVMGLIGFVVMLGINDTEVQKAGFFQRRLDDEAITPTGDEIASSRTVPNRVKNIVERGSTLYAPASGIRPMIARYWADPASVPKSDLETVDEGDDSSFLAKMYEIDPTSDEVLKHTPAHLTFSPSLTLDVDDDELATGPTDGGVAALPSAIEASLSNVSKRLNWRFIATALGGGALLYFGAMDYFGSQLVAGVLASIPTLVAGTKAVDGSLSVEPGPYHYNDVRAMVATERKEYVARETFDDLHREIHNMDWQVLDRAQKTVQTLRKEMANKMDQMFGTDLSDASEFGGDDDGGDGVPDWVDTDSGEQGVADD